MATILLIEDAHDIRQMVELVLQSAGHTVLTATNGHTGLWLAERIQPDLIVMDLVLPRLNGWEATRRLKATPTTQHIPVLAITAHVFSNEIERALKAGCAVVLPKPFEMTTFLHQIDVLLSQGPRHNRERSVGD
jgi:two-component system, cell cycle response regulator DivK